MSSMEPKPKDEAIITMFGMEKQQLHNTALSILYGRDKYPYHPDLVNAAEKYLINLLISATNDLGKKIELD